MGDDQLGHEELLTTRLSLRRPTPAAIDAIYRIHHDPAACAHNPADMLTTPADAEDRYHRWEQHWHQHGFGYWVVHPRKVDGQRDILGFCGLKLMRLQDREILNLFYRLDPAVWGNGIATEAATAVVNWATTHLPDRPVVARVRPDNVASATVAERTGLRRDAHLDTAGEDGLDWIFVKNWAPSPTQSPGPPVTARD
jgi:RimJ/RimL family protein N-acetyltransferase